LLGLEPIDNDNGEPPIDLDQPAGDDKQSPSDEIVQ
jgi:hypothetical protein